MKKIYISANILAVLALFALFYHTFINKSSDDINISCHGILVSGNQHTASRMRVSLFLNGNRGRVNFDGIVESDNHRITVIRRASSFFLARHENGYMISQSIVSELPGNTASADVLRSMFPSFMLFNGEDYRFNMYSVGNGNFLFMSDKFVTLYCSR
jgi:hypothetical protein